MTTAQTHPAPVAVTTSRFVAAELRAEIARAGISQRQVADHIRMPQAWLSRRLSPHASGEVDLTFEETESICAAVGVDAELVIANALRARRDSNPKPSDSEPLRGRVRHLRVVRATDDPAAFRSAIHAVS